ncbi:MAG: HEPN domain-containing protein [Acidobacteriaceae bacterium]
MEAKDPYIWMKYAEADMKTALVLAGMSDLSGQVIFHALQAAGKSLKALIIEQGINPKKTRDLSSLIADLATQFPELVQFVPKAVKLTSLYTSTRYPVNLQFPQGESVDDFILLAGQLLKFAKDRIAKP